MYRWRSALILVAVAVVSFFLGSFASRHAQQSTIATSVIPKHISTPKPHRQSTMSPLRPRRDDPPSQAVLRREWDRASSNSIKWNAPPSPPPGYTVVTPTPIPAAAMPSSTWTPPQTLPLQGAAPSSDCETDSIDSVSDDGSVITMISGASYEVGDADQATSSVWLSAEDVIICDEGGTFKIIDKDQDSDSVEATKVN